MTLTTIKPAGLSKPVDLADNEKIRLGTGNDLQIYHDGSVNFIDSPSHELRLRGTYVALQPNGGGEQMALGTANGSFAIFYDGSEKLATVSNGVSITGNALLSDSTGANSGKLQFGSSQDLAIYHDGSNSYLEDTGTGDLIAKVAASNFRVRGAGNAEIAKFGDDGSVDLYYDGSKIFETGADQATITGKLTINRTNDEKLIFSGSDSPYIRFKEGTTNKAYMQWSANGYLEIYNQETSKYMRIGGQGVEVVDNVKFTAGDSQDLQIYHDGSHSYVHDAGTGHLRIRGDDVEITDHTNNNNMARFIEGGAVELYHNDSKRFETTADGIKITPDASGVMISSGGDTNWTTGAINVLRLGSNQADMRLASNYGVRIGLSGNNDANEFTLQQDNSNNAYIRNEASNSIRFQTGGSTTRISVDADGLKFGSDTAAANALADYEEGNWTPVVGGWDTFSPYSGSSYNLGWYRKIGKLVYVGWKLYIQNLTTVSSSAQINIQGLPFNSSSSSAGPVAHVRFDIPEFGFEGYPLGYLPGSSNLIYMNKHVDGGNHLVAIDATANRSNVWCMGSATYVSA